MNWLDFDPADKVEVFFEAILRLPDGRPFVLADWQREHLRRVFGTLKNGRRQYRTTYWEVPKKNGKSTLTAGVALYCLVADDEPSAHVYLAAASRDQTLHVFRPAAEMVRNSPELRDRCRIYETTKTIVDQLQPNAFLRAVAADAGTQDGAEPHACIFDELHRQKDRDLYAVMKKGMSTRRQPLMFGITTAGISSDSPLCWELHEYAEGVKAGVFSDASFYPVIYSLEEGADWTDEANWRTVNPALGEEDEPGKFKRIDALREDFLQAKRSPALENDFRRYELNQWVAQETRWIPLAEWDKAPLFNPEELLGRPCFGGLDLATTTDVSAFVLVFPWDDGSHRLLPFFWLPEETARESQVPFLMWAKQNLIDITEGAVTDYRRIQKRIEELGDLYEIIEIGYDPWNASQVSVELTDAGHETVQVRQGFAGMNPPCRAFETAVLSHKMQHNGNPVMRWMVDCCSVKQDPGGSGYIRPVKPDRRRTTKRIDGIIAALMALDRCVRKENERSVYLDPDTAVM